MTNARAEPATNDDEAPELAPALESGRVVAERYRIERVLGSGGMGTVHEATQLALDRRVALKVLHPALTTDRSLVARFRREAKVMAGLKHPNIVEVIDAGQEGSLVFLVMEYLTGVPLNTRVEAEMPMAPGALLPLVLPVGRALSFVHKRGIVHRDVKPDNIFLVRGDDGAITPKLLDFGIARPVSGGKSITATGVILGTPAYMAPEQAWGLKEITPAADQWAFGAMLYEALGGEIPHLCETPHALIVRRVSEAARPLTEIAPGVDPALAAVVMRALATDPTARYESMDALLDALAPFAAERGPAAVAPVAPAAPKPAAMAATMTAPEEQTAPEPEARVAEPEAVMEPEAAPVVPVAPLRFPRVLAGLMVAAAVAATGFALTRGDSAPRPTPTAAPTVVEMVTLTFDFSPQEARIELDGAELGAGHASVEVTRAGVHTLRVEADGYLPYVDAVRADGDLRISRSLVRRAVDAAVVASPTARPARPVTGAPAAAHAPIGRRPIDTRWPP
ncbi:MAG: serine/threonine-protein kinase [Deltaproteobacteria bacterium]|nr:serine/threonine-protein kinase [Myxococcales bacterium]MDP3216266.1 serine/threonine-protein kinase [Deltaproteobacteria bacterium]